MLNREAEIFVEHVSPRAFDRGWHDEETAVDLLPPVHPRGVLLPDETALGEADAVELRGVAFEPEDVAKLRAAFAHAEPQAVLEPAARGVLSRCKPAIAERGQARIGVARRTVARPMDRERRVAFDRDRPSQ